MKAFILCGGCVVKSQTSVRVISIDEIAAHGKNNFPPGLLEMRYASTATGAEHTDRAFIKPSAGGDIWVIFIHGHGALGDQLFTRDDIRRLWLPEFLTAGVGILAPDLRRNAWMSPAAADDLHWFISYIRKQYGARRTLFFSGSMGGTSNLIYSILYPEDVTAAVALGAASDLASYHTWCRKHNQGIIKEIADAIECAYGGTPDEIPGIYRRHSALINARRLAMPVFLAHGENDSTIPVEEARRLAGAMKGASTFRYEEITGGEHDSPLARIDAFAWAMDRIHEK